MNLRATVNGTKREYKNIQFNIRQVNNDNVIEKNLISDFPHCSFFHFHTNTLFTLVISFQLLLEYTTISDKLLVYHIIRAVSSNFHKFKKKTFYKHKSGMETNKNIKKLVILCLWHNSGC